MAKLKCCVRLFISECWLLKFSVSNFKSSLKARSPFQSKSNVISPTLINKVLSNLSLNSVYYVNLILHFRFSYHDNANNISSLGCCAILVYHSRIMSIWVNQCPSNIQIINCTYQVKIIPNFLITWRILWIYQ